MIHFFRDILSGPLYIIISILALFFIMAIIGFLMERKKLEEEKNAHVAVISNKIPEQKKEQPVTPIAPVSMENLPKEQPQPLSDIPATNKSLEVKDPVIIFEDPDQKKE